MKSWFRVSSIFILGGGAAILTYHDSYWWEVLKTIPLCFAAFALDNWLSEKWTVVDE